MRVSGRDCEAERRELAARFADGDGAILQAFEKRALRLLGNAVDFIEQDDFRRGERAELGDERAGCRIDHLEADDFGGLQVGAALKPGKFRVADSREDHAEEGLANARYAAQQEIPGIDLSLPLSIVGRWNLGQEDDVRQRLLGPVSDQRLVGLGHDRDV